MFRKAFGIRILKSEYSWSDSHFSKMGILSPWLILASYLNSDENCNLSGPRASNAFLHCINLYLC